MLETYRSLHALRGLAALAVLLFHAEAVIGVQLAPSGYLAVDLFFILSGFVIAHAYDARFEAGLSARAFIIARAVRFWPLFALGTLIGGGWLILENIVAPPAALSVNETLALSGLALVYLPRLSAGDLFPLNVPAWSLLFELAVNAAFAVFFASTRTKWLPVTIALSGVGVTALSLTGAFDVQAWGMVRATFGFTVGVWIYRRRWHPPAVPAGAIIALVCLTFGVPASRVWEIACILGLYPAAIAMLARTEAAGHVSVLDRLGDLSFPLYALHYPLLQIVLGVRDYLPAPAWAIGPGAIIGCLLAAWLGEVLVDQPARAFTRRRHTALGKRA